MAYKTADFVFFIRLSVIAAILLNEPWLNSVADFGKTFPSHECTDLPWINLFLQ